LILTVQIADVGLRQGLRILSRPPRPRSVPGLRYAETLFTAPLGGRRPQAPNFGRVALLATWSEDAAFEAFLGSHPLARRLGAGWQVRMKPLRVFGSWPGMDGLPERQLPVAPEEPVVVLTLGRLLPWRVRPFLRASLPAETDAVAQPSLLATTAFSRLPNLVSTFSVWRTVAEMRGYAYDRGSSHQAAVAADRARPFHRHSAFIRLRPYATAGAWEGADPLSGLLRTPASS
jgi:hypothetical protein